MQPVSRDWIGLDAEVRRADIPIRQVNEKYITKTKRITNYLVLYALASL